MVGKDLPRLPISTQRAFVGWYPPLGLATASPKTASSAPWLGAEHLDEMVCSVGGKRMYLWQVVDDDGEVLDLVVQHQRDAEAVSYPVGLARASLSAIG